MLAVLPPDIFTISSIDSLSPHKQIITGFCQLSSQQLSIQFNFNIMNPSALVGLLYISLIEGQGHVHRNLLSGVTT